MMPALVLALLAQRYTSPDTYTPTDPGVSVFGQLKVTQEYPVFALSFQYNVNDALVSTSTAGGGTVTQASSRAVLQTSTGAAGSATLQSREAVRYVPGQGVRIRMTATFTAGVANSRQEIGLGDANDGFFFGYKGVDFGVFHRNAGVETFIARTAWNASRLTFSPQLGNVYTITYQWLGYGVIRFYVERADGRTVLVHQIDYPNTAALPSLGNPIMRAWVRAKNEGNTTNLTVATPSIGVVAEGLPEEHGVVHGRSSRKAIASGAATYTRVIALQNKATFQAQENKVRVKVTGLYVNASGAADINCQLRRNASVAGSPSYTDVETAVSVSAFDVAGTTVTGGRIVYAAAFEGGVSMHVGIPELEVYIEPGEVMDVACNSSTGSPTVNASINWSEEF